MRAPIYRADVLVLGGDVAGKAIQTIVREPRRPAGDCSLHRCRLHDIEDGPELEALERLIEDHGYYPYRASPARSRRSWPTAASRRFFATLMEQRLAAWLSLADDRLRPAGTPLFLMLGNDDPLSLRPLLDAAPWGTHAEGRVVMLDEGHEMISWGYSNITPWHSHRELTEEQLAAALREMAASCATPSARSSTSTCRRTGHGSTTRRSSTPTFASSRSWGR